MKLSKAEILLLTLTGAFVVFLSGFYIGRSSAGGVLTVQTQRQSEEPEQPNIEPEPEAVDEPSSEAKTDAEEAPAQDGGAGAEASESETVPVNINTASAEELETLPGIGEVLAERIIAHREQYGAFRIVDEIMDVRGIGEATFEELKDYITVG